MVKPKYLILVHCGIKILLKNVLVCEKDLFNLGDMIRKFDLKGLTVSLLKSNKLIDFKVLYS